MVTKRPAPDYADYRTPYATFGRPSCPNIGLETGPERRPALFSPDPSVGAITLVGKGGSEGHHGTGPAGRRDTSRHVY